MNKLICDKCGTANESGTLHCRQCGGKLTIRQEAKSSKSGRWFRKVLKRALIVFLILLVAALTGLYLLLFKTSGFSAAEAPPEDTRALERILKDIYQPRPAAFQLSAGEATLLAGKLLEKSGITAKSGTKVEVFIHNDRNTVSVVLYSKALDAIPSRCELGFHTGDDEPELKYARFGELFMPGILKEAVVKYFEYQALKGDNTKLVERIERVIPRGNNRIIVKLEKD